MIEVKITRLDGVEIKRVPATWRDVTWDKFVEIEGTEFENEVHRLSVVSGIEQKDLLNNLTLLTQVAEVCQFMYDDLDEWVLFMPEKYRKVEVGKDEWGKLEAAKSAALSNPKNKWAGGKETVKYYTGEDIGDKPCVDVIGTVAFFLPKLVSSLIDTNY